jgi:hypothetical protein
MKYRRFIMAGTIARPLATGCAKLRDIARAHLRERNFADDPEAGN